MSGFLMLVLLTVTAAGVLALRQRQRRHRAREHEADLAAQLAAAAHVAQEDVAMFAEDLHGLEATVDEHAVTDPSAAHAHARARRAYAEARRMLQSASRLDDVARVTGALADGRYALACVVAVLHRRPRPTRRPPCFFNPGHGPSCREVTWAPRGCDSARRVPTCAADADRIAAGADPNIRTVAIEGERVPYWEAGPAFVSYARGYLEGPR